MGGRGPGAGAHTSGGRKIAEKTSPQKSRRETKMEPETGLPRLGECGVPKRGFWGGGAEAESLENSSFLAEVAWGEIGVP